MPLTEVHIETDKVCPECERKRDGNPAAFTYIHGLEEPGVYALCCVIHGAIESE